MAVDSAAICIVQLQLPPCPILLACLQLDRSCSNMEEDGVGIGTCLKCIYQFNQGKKIKQNKPNQTENPPELCKATPYSLKEGHSCDTMIWVLENYLNGTKPISVSVLA